jgi:hypothetical protein
MAGNKMNLGEHKPRTALTGKCSVRLILGGLLVSMCCLLAAAWKRAIGSFEADHVSQEVTIRPMRLSSLIAGNNRARGGELVYLARVLLKPGPTPQVFFLTGSHGTQILAVAGTAHVVATPGQIVDVRGIIRSTPPISVLRRQWKLGPRQAKLVSQNPIYIEPNLIRESGD